MLQASELGIEEDLGNYWKFVRASDKFSIKSGSFLCNLFFISILTKQVISKTLRQVFLSKNLS